MTTSPKTTSYRQSIIRRRTATHMSKSKQAIPHVWVSTEVNYSNVDLIRQEKGISYLPFIISALAKAIISFPLVNGVFQDKDVIAYEQINIGVAIDLDFKGLVVPVVNQANKLSLIALSEQLADLANRARANKLSPDEMSNGTFTLTSLGAFGTHETHPVINYPQVAILSSDGIKRQPVVVKKDGDEEVAIAPVGKLVLAWDHRAFDGAYAAAFLREVRTELESRDWLQC